MTNKTRSTLHFPVAAPYISRRNLASALAITSISPPFITLIAPSPAHALGLGTIIGTIGGVLLQGLGWIYDASKVVTAAVDALTSITGISVPSTALRSLEPEIRNLVASQQGAAAPVLANTSSLAHLASVLVRIGGNPLQLGTSDTDHLTTDPLSFVRQNPSMLIDNARTFSAGLVPVDAQVPAGGTALAKILPNTTKQGFYPVSLYSPGAEANAAAAVFRIT